VEKTTGFHTVKPVGVGLRQQHLSAGYKVPSQPDVILDTVQGAPFFESFLCLSRACHGKSVIASIKSEETLLFFLAYLFTEPESLANG
jgi:hypothetical protein